MQKLVAKVYFGILDAQEFIIEKWNPHCLRIIFCFKSSRKPLFFIELNTLIGSVLKIFWLAEIFYKKEKRKNFLDHPLYFTFLYYNDIFPSQLFKIRTAGVT